MAIYGIGAMYDGTDDMTETFLSKGGAYLGWRDQEAPYAHQLLRRIGVGDVIYIKSYSPQTGLYIKAVGMVMEPAEPVHDDDLGTRLGVDWRWVADPLDEPLLIGKVEDKADFMRRGSLYEEMNPTLQRRIVGLLLGAET